MGLYIVLLHRSINSKHYYLRLQAAQGVELLTRLGVTCLPISKPCQQRDCHTGSCPQPPSRHVTFIASTCSPGQTLKHAQVANRTTSSRSSSEEVLCGPEPAERDLVLVQESRKANFEVRICGGMVSLHMHLPQ